MLKLKMCSPDKLVEPSENGAKVVYEDPALKWWVLKSLGLDGELSPNDMSKLVVLVDDRGGVVEVWAVMPHNSDTAYMVYPQDKMYEVL